MASRRIAVCMDVTPTVAAARRSVGLVTAARAIFDEVAAASPGEPRNGPRWRPGPGHADRAESEVLEPERR